MKSTRWMHHRMVALLSLGVFAAGCSGEGSSAVTPLPNGFPAADRKANAVQARVSQTGLAVLTENFPTILETLVPGGLDFDIPEVCGSNPEICCGSAAGYCQLLVDATAHEGDPPRLEIVPLDPPGNELTLLLRLRGRTPNASDPGGERRLPVSYDYGIGTANCTVALDTEWDGAASISAEATVDFVLDAQAGATTRIEVADITISDLDSGDFDLTGDFECTVADVLKGLLMGIITSQLEAQIQTTIETMLCKPCTGDGDCAPFGTCNGDGVCELPDGSGGTQCLQELGTSGRVAASGLFGALGQGMLGGIDFYAVAGGTSRTNDSGVSLGMLGGVIPSDGRIDRCVPEREPPNPPAGGIPESTTLEANARPDGTSFDLAVGVHRHFLDQAAWAAYASGLICVNVGTSAVSMLSSGTLAILMPSIYDLLHDQDAPITLAVRPQQPPTFTFGAGTFTSEGDLDEPLITVSVPDLQIDFYTIVDEASARLLTLEADVVLPLGLDVNEAGELVPVLGDVANAIQNITITNSDLLLEDPAELAAAFPSILAIALPYLQSSISPIALPAIAGLQLSVPAGGLTSVDASQVLAVFAELAPATLSGKTQAARVDTTVSLRSLRLPATEAFRVGHLERALRPTAEIQLGGLAPARAGGPLEWQVRLDGGFWSPWRRAASLTFSREALWLQGNHKFEARARVVGRPETVDREPAQLELLIDTIAPAVTVASAPGRGRTVRVNARDLVTPEERLFVEYRLEEGAWHAAGAAPAQLSLGDADPATLQIRVTDESGNVTVTSANGVALADDGTANGASCGCRVGGAAAGGHGPGTFLFGAAALALVATMRKTRRRALARTAAGLAVLVVVAAAQGCSCSSNTTGDDPDAGLPDGGGLTSVEPGPTGRWNDVAASGGRVLVSAYEQKFGDLVVGEMATDGTVTFQPIDGVPEGPVVLDPAGYRGGIKAAGTDVGAWTSIALANGEGMIAYQDREAGTLKFAVESNGVWTTHVVDDDIQGGQVGLYSSLVIDAAGLPAIAYMAHGLVASDGSRKAQLRWVQATTAQPASIEDWSAPEVIDQAWISCAGLCADGEVCVAASDTCHVPDTNCGACAAGEACVSGACAAVRADPTVPDLPQGLGLFASAGFLSDGTPIVAHYDRTETDLKLTVRGSAGWSTSTLDGATTDAGQWASLVTGPELTAYVAYQDAVAGSLHVIPWTNGVAGTKETVDDGTRDDVRPHPVGASAALILDSAGELAVAYQDGAVSDLIQARRGADGTWTRADLATGPEGFGFFIRAAVDGGTVWVSNYVYDRRVTPPGELRLVMMQ